MRIHKMLAVAAGLAVAMLGTGVARADSGGLDPHAKIVVPTDPTLEPCSSVEAPTVCFDQTNSIQNPADIEGPTAQELASDPNFDITTSFIYEPDNCSYTDTACLAADTLDYVFLDVVPTIPFASYNCFIGAGPGTETPAFNGCSPTGVTYPDGNIILELSCVSTVANPCTGMLAGQEGTSEITPEPGTLLLLGAGLPLMALYALKRRKALDLGRQNQTNLAAC
jgi:hypothetical protein